MTKGELAVIVKKVQAECGLEDPTKITYYRDEEGRVVFKLWFDSLILPETLAGKKKDEFEWKANVNNTFINNEPYLYDDDFTILEYNEEKGWVKVLPDQQDFEIVESYNKLIDSKDEDSVRLQGKKLNEKVAKAYSLTLYEAEDEVASDINTLTNDPNFTQKEVENKKDEKTNKVEEKVPTIFFAFSLCCPGLVVEEYKAFAKLIQEANEKAGQSENKATVKLIYFNSADSAALALLDMGQMISILESQGIKTNNSNFLGSDMKSIIDTLTGENVCDLSKSHVIASATAAEKIAKEYASLQKLITAENTIKGYDHIEFAKIRDAMTKLEQLSSDRMSQVLEPLAKSISEAYCKAADDGKIAAAKKATSSNGEEKKEKDPEAPKVDKSKENSEEGSGENSGEKSEQNESRRLLKSILAGRLLEDEEEKKPEGEDGEEKKPESEDDSFIEAWKNAFEKYGDGTGLPEPNQALIIYLDSYLANHGGGDINKYYPQSEAKQNFEDRNNAAKAAFEQVKDMKANSKYTIDSLMKVGLMKTVAAKIASKGLKDDDFKPGDNANGESTGFSFKQTNKPQPISPDKKEFKAKEHAKLTAVDYHIFSTMNIEPPKEAADKLAMYWTAQGVER